MQCISSYGEIRRMNLFECVVSSLSFFAWKPHGFQAIFNRITPPIRYQRNENDEYSFFASRLCVCASVIFVAIIIFSIEKKY